MYALISRKTASFPCLVLLSAFVACISARADEVGQIRASTDAAAQLYHSGDVLGAMRVLEEIVGQEPTPDTRLAHRYALLTLVELCQSVYDQTCVIQNAGRILASRRPADRGDLEMLVEAYSSAVSLSSMAIEMLAADEQQSARVETVFDVIEASYPRMLELAPHLYIGANFAQADVFLKRNQLEQAELALDRAIAAMVTTEPANDFELAKQVRTSLSLLLRTGQSDRADRLLNIASPFLDRAGSLSVPENIHIQLVLGHVLVARNKGPAALAAYRKGLDALDQLSVARYMKDWLAHEF